MSHSMANAGNVLPEQPVGRFYAWWRGDRLPSLPARDDVLIDQDSDPETIQQVGWGDRG